MYTGTKRCLLYTKHYKEYCLTGYSIHAKCKENTSLDHGHLQVHNELKPSNRVINIYLYSFLIS